MDTISNNSLKFRSISRRIPSDIHTHLNRCWLVGSQARGDAGRHSDVDILIESKEASPDWLLKVFRRSICPGDRVDTLKTYFQSGKKNVFGDSTKTFHFIIANLGEDSVFPEKIQLS
jgi:hypothetical protein